MCQIRTDKFPRKGGEGTTLHNKGFLCNCLLSEQRGFIPGKSCASKVFTMVYKMGLTRTYQATDK